MLVLTGPYLLTGNGESEPTPVSLACQYGYTSMLNIFLKWSILERVVIDPSGPQTARRTDYDSFILTILGIDSWDNNIDLLTYPWSANIYNHDPPVLMALRDGPIKKSTELKLLLLRMLDEYGFDMDQRSPVDGSTGLTVAIEQNNEELVTELASFYNCRVVVTTSLNEFTQLHLACQMQHWRLIPILVEALSDQEDLEEYRGTNVARATTLTARRGINKIDCYGRTCLDIAIQALPMTGTIRQRTLKVVDQLVKLMALKAADQSPLTQFKSIMMEQLPSGTNLPDLPFLTGVDDFDPSLLVAIRYLLEAGAVPESYVPQDEVRVKEVPSFPRMSHVDSSISMAEEQVL